MRLTPKLTLPRSRMAKGSFVLLILLNALFFPALWRDSTLLTSSRDAPSVMQSGAYNPAGIGRIHISRTPDPGAPAWMTEPLFKIIASQYWTEHRLPLWNPHSAYGTPLAAAMQPQPFFPPTVLLSTNTTAWTYNLFIIGRLLIAGILMLGYARLFLDVMSATLAAVTFMLTGYFIVFLNMPHLSVEVLLPGIFLAFELLLRRKDLKSVAGIGLVVFLSVVSGMPESTFLIVSFGCVYFLFRLLSVVEFRARAVSLVFKLVAGVAFGFALSAFLLLPFVEFMRVAHDTHQSANIGGDRAGLVADDDLRWTIEYLLPMIFGPVNNSIFSGFSGWTGMRSYWGIIPCILAAAALIRSFFPTRHMRAPWFRPLTLFFAISLLVMMLKRFGSPVVNWIGHLPISELVLYVKYQEPLMAMCIAMLAGIGYSLLRHEQRNYVTFLAAAVAVLAIMLTVAKLSYPLALAHKQFDQVYYLVGAVGILIVLVFVCITSLWAVYNGKSWPRHALFVCLCLELSFNFIFPSFYRFNRLATTERSAYSGAPYIEFLKARNTDRARVFAREGLLYPNWSGVFGLSDVRALDAMYFQRYRSFIRAFLIKPGDEVKRHGDLADRFTGAEPGYSYSFDSDKEKRFLSLSSVRYLISPTPYDMSSKVVDEVLAQHKSESIWGLGPARLESGGGKSSVALFQHPPSAPLPYKTTINPDYPLLEGVAALTPPAEDKSDGVDFTIQVRDDTRTEPVLQLTINPKDVAADKGGRPFRVDLSRYAGKEVDIFFSTGPGPGGNNGFDWAVWAELKFSPVAGSGAQRSVFQKIYDREVFVYEWAGAFPRAALFTSVEILPDDAVLSRITDASFPYEQKVALSRESIGGDEDLLRSFSDASPQAHTAAQILAYDSQLVRIRTETESPSLLVLNDSYYPGWRAYVNGNPASVYSANYLFRAVAVPAGTSEVEFRYEPMSFKVGAGISLAALLVFAGVGLASRWRKPRKYPIEATSTMSKAG